MMYALRANDGCASHKLKRPSPRGERATHSVARGYCDAYIAAHRGRMRPTRVAVKHYGNIVGVGALDDPQRKLDDPKMQNAKRKMQN